MTVGLLGYGVTGVKFDNKLVSGTRVAFQNNFAFQVRYGESGKDCRGEMKVTVTDSADTAVRKFLLEVTMFGIFRLPEGMTKEQAHVECFRRLFPYLKAYVSTVTAAGGMAPIMIPEIDPDTGTVYRVDVHPEGKE